jgi:hypothetical protein
MSPNQEKSVIVRSTKPHRSHWNLRISDVCILRPQSEDIHSRKKN